MYRTYFYILILVAVVAGHCVYTWSRARREKDRRPWSRGTKVYLAVLAALCASAVIGGLVVVLAHLEPTASHALAGIGLLMAVWFDFRLNRACGK